MLDIPMASAAKRGSLTSAKSLHELKRDAMDGPSDSQDAAGTSADVRNEETGGKPKGIRPSKSETSIIESFVVVEKRNNANYLRDGEHESEKFAAYQFVEYYKNTSYFIDHRFCVATTAGIPLQVDHAHGV